MKQEIIKAIERFCEYEDMTYYDDYSGRCMYGRECVGVACGDTIETLRKIISWLISDLDYDNAVEIIDLLGIPRTDSLGLDMILYFPSLRTN